MTSQVPLVGVNRALDNQAAASPVPTIFDEFALKGRVAIVTGGNRGLGLEMAMALAEAGARVYSIDLPTTPGKEFTAVAKYVEKLGDGRSLQYIQADVTDQASLWAKVEEIGNKEGRMDVCIAAAGILHEANCLEYKAEDFQKVMDVNVNGVLYSAQAAGRMMDKFGNGGSIILIASISGTITNAGHPWVAYNTSKSAVLQMTRSLACELGVKRIRVNSISPGHIYTKMTAAFVDKFPELTQKWSGMNPLGRLGRPDELRGVATWLASDASTFCTGSDIIVSGGHHSW
jgi:NAD(P)-dependent dehydrogenase (short-subunit alcohol dehydrogenase family)